MPGDVFAVGSVIVSETGGERLQLVGRAGDATFLIGGPAPDEIGPSPFDLLGAALAASTVLTIRGFADRHQVPLVRLHVDVSHRRASHGRDQFERAIMLEGALDDAQRQRLVEVADDCPVGRILAARSDIRTFIRREGRALVSVTDRRDVLAAADIELNILRTH